MNWPLVSLGDVADIKIGPFGSLLHKEDYVQGEHALVNPSHIIEGKICIDNKLTVNDKKYNELSSYHLHLGDVVLGRRGEMGRCAVVYNEGFLCGTGSIIIRPNNKFKAYFLQAILSNPSYKKTLENKAIGATMMNLNVPIVSSLKIPLLPISLQEEYITLLKLIDKSKFSVQKEINFYQELLEKKMNEYFG